MSGMEAGRGVTYRCQRGMDEGVNLHHDSNSVGELEPIAGWEGENPDDKTMSGVAGP